MPLPNLAKRIKNIKTSSTLAIQEEVLKLKKEGKEIISFTVGQPDFDTPINIKDAAKLALDNGYTKYTAVAGIIELREALSKKLKNKNNLHYSPNNIIVSNGGKQSLMNAIYAIIDNNDEVIIPKPYWLSYTEMIKIAGGISVLIETKAINSYKITADEFEKAITPNTKAIIINSPNNPTGAVYTRDELIKLGEIATKYNLYIISDEVYEYLNYTNEKHCSIASINEDLHRRTITINALSKAYAMTGWRIGYMAANDEIIKAATKIQSQQTSNICSIAQYAAIEALSDRSSSNIDNMVKIFANRRNILLNEIKKINNISYTFPDGAFYLFIDFSKFINKSYKNTILNNASDIAIHLIKDFGVAVIPCTDFGMKNHIRLSYAISENDIIKGIEKINEFTQEIN